MELRILKQLSEVSVKHADAIAVELAEALRELEAARAKLATLQRYVDEYESGLAQGLEQGMSAAGSRNYQQFMLNLTVALSAQRRILTGHRAQLGNLQLRWIEACRRKQGYETLQLRAEARARQAEVRRLQKELDELGQRRAGGDESGWGCPA